ncbi:hypothetical protein EU534_02645 [Candidatus Heimdallarchaeota archaeon]|nr:MAG: hypothetical protein EU534_02645 [Candidatus Heimdallarchaeota archaeon]
MMEMKIEFETSDFETLNEYQEYRLNYLKSVEALKKDWKRIEDAIITRASSLLPYREFPVEIRVTISLSTEEDNDSIFVHPVYTSDTEAFVSKASHKVHSLLCYELTKYDVDLIPDEHKGIISTLETIQIEGIGDHIDKEYFVNCDDHLYPDESYTEEFTVTLRNISQTITDFNELLKRIAQESADKEKLGEELRKFTPPYGNPLGYYMTTIIIKNSLLDEMLGNLGNPFDFFRLYNKAVSKDRFDIPSFSEETTRYLRKLEELYLKKN